MTTQKLNPNYRNQIVYLRKGTNIIVNETEANKKDPNLVPMTVGDAISHGYLADPVKNIVQDPVEVQLREENDRLQNMLNDMKTQHEQTQLQLHEMKSRLDEAEAISEHSVSGPIDIVNEELPGTTVQDDNTVSSDDIEVTPPSDPDKVVNLAVDADSDGVSELEKINTDDNTQEELDVLLGNTPTE